MSDIRCDFPLLSNHLENGRPLTYLDNAATTQKPASVIRAVSEYYRQKTANPHRGAYALSAEATALYENARRMAADFIKAPSPENIVFTKNTTEAINLAAFGYGRYHLTPGDEILISVAEHHSNLLPWQQISQETGAVLRYLYTGSDGRLNLDEVNEKISTATKIVAISHTSNVLGLANPVAEIIALAHQSGAVVLLDGAQGVPHEPVDVAALDVDFMAFSGHKMLGPDGIGVLYGKADLLNETRPLMLGGGIVEEVSQQSVRLLEPPLRFEAGTPNVEGAAGLMAAIEYIDQIGFPAIQQKEAQLTAYTASRLKEVPCLELYGDPGGKGHTSIFAFNLTGVHPHDAATILDAAGITVRAGHHCAQPLMKHLKISSCCRASLYFYNTIEEIDRFIDGLKTVRRCLGLESS